MLLNSTSSRKPLLRTEACCTYYNLFCCIPIKVKCVDHTRSVIFRAFTLDIFGAIFVKFGCTSHFERKACGVWNGRQRLGTLSQVGTLERSQVLEHTNTNAPRWQYSYFRSKNNRCWSPNLANLIVFGNGACDTLSQGEHSSSWFSTSNPAVFLRKAKVGLFQDLTVVSFIPNTILPKRTKKKLKSPHFDWDFTVYLFYCTYLHA